MGGPCASEDRQGLAYGMPWPLGALGVPLWLCLALRALLWADSLPGRVCGGGGRGRTATGLRLSGISPGILRLGARCPGGGAPGRAPQGSAETVSEVSFSPW